MKLFQTRSIPTLSIPARRSTHGLRLALLAFTAGWAATAAIAQDAAAEGDPAATDAVPADGTEAALAESGDASATEGDTEAPAEAGEAESAEGSEAAPAEGEAAAAAPTSEDLQSADQEYDLKVKELEGKINDLKESIFRSKAKLTLLTQAVTEGGLGQGASAIIVHKNEMGGSFVLTEVDYFLDGAPLWQEVDEDGSKLTAKRDHVVWDGNIVEGTHTLTVQMVYRGNGSGIFSYISGYTFRLKDSHTFSAEPGKRITLQSIGFEQGNFTTELTERPSIRFDTEVEVNEGLPGKAAE